MFLAWLAFFGQRFAAGAAPPPAGPYWSENYWSAAYWSAGYWVE